MARKRAERSAGFVVFRERAGRREYLVVLDRKHGNWGFPKGHLESGETSIAAARREAREEAGISGLRPARGFRKSVGYRLPSGRKKRAVYFLARMPRGARVRPGRREIADFRWLPPERARQRLTFRALRRLVRDAERFLAGAKPRKRPKAGSGG